MVFTSAFSQANTANRLRVDFKQPSSILCLSGRLLASFRSSFAQLVPDEASEVYVKNTKSPPA